MSKPTVYLAGPILDCTAGEANDWRNAVKTRLADHGIVGISPLRCEPLRGERYAVEYADARFGTPRAISGKNRFDVDHCTLTLAYFPFAETERYPSLGTVAEIGAAHMARKPVVTVSTHPKIVQHPVINGFSTWLLPTLDDALDTIIGVLGDYA